MINANKTAAWILGVISLVFFGITVLFGFLVSDHEGRLYIIETGESTMAYLTAYKSNTSVNDEPLYRFEYEYYNIFTEQTEYGSTGDKYYFDEANDIWMTGRLHIYYTETTSVEADYKTNNSGGVLYTFLIIFPTVGCLLLFICLINVNKVIQAEKIRRVGIETTGTFVKMEGGIWVNNSQYHKIWYTFQNEAGATISSRSSESYSFHEASMFRQAKTFQIKYIGNRSVIAERPAVFIDAATGSATSSNLPKASPVENPSYTYPQAGAYRQQTIYCEYCSSAIPSNKNKCPSCGAKRRA